MKTCQKRSSGVILYAKGIQCSLSYSLCSYPRLYDMCLLRNMNHGVCKYRHNLFLHRLRILKN